MVVVSESYARYCEAMTRDEKLKRYQEAGAGFLDAARARAEEFLHDATSAGEATQERAAAAVDDLLGSSRRGTDQLIEAIRREISSQLKASGLAKIVDLEALERRLTRWAPNRTATGTSDPTERPDIAGSGVTAPASDATTPFA